MMKCLILSLSLALAACGSDNNSNSSSPVPDGPGATIPTEPGEQLQFPTTATKALPGKVIPNENGQQYNAEAVIPPQCYTKHEQKHNPCMVCHQTYKYGDRPNSMNDGFLQAEYGFSDEGLTNRWQNLFEDRRPRMAKISNQQVIDYINTDNYTTLIEQLESMPDWEGPVPKIENLHLGAEAFDEHGFAKDGSHWVAFNYKPLPSTFWPTNGATDDVMVRLPEAFRNTSCNTGEYSRHTYMANLAIMEMAIQDLDSVTVPPIDESKVCDDLNGDGVMNTVTEIKRMTHYVGQARPVAVNKMLYPQGVEFLHSVRYVGVDKDHNIMIPPRMKELRYMRKKDFFDVPALRSKYGNEFQEKLDGNLPNYINKGQQGTNNGFGWMVLGFIEAKEGHLRMQNEEETFFCMGCHTTIGSTIDDTFAFPRKVTGADGWGYINLKGMKDAPYVGSDEGEIMHYLKTVGGGNEFRENDEIIQKWFNPDGSVKEADVKAADVYTLIAPSVERALALNKAYMTIVEDQDYIHGRDANLKPAVNVYKQVDPETAPVLPANMLRQWDMRLQWHEAAAQAAPSATKATK